jgi:hypothetical protein
VDGDVAEAVHLLQALRETGIEHASARQ